MTSNQMILVLPLEDSFWMQLTSAAIQKRLPTIITNPSTVIKNSGSMPGEWRRRAASTSWRLIETKFARDARKVKTKMLDRVDAQACEMQTNAEKFVLEIG